MGKLKILADENIPYLRGRLEPVADIDYIDQDGFTTGLVKDADVLLIRTRTRCNEELLSGSKVKLIATATIGMDQIDLEWCREAGIAVANSPGCNAPAVAQYVWSSLLRQGLQPGVNTVGVVGCGNVGNIVADWGRKLGFNVLVNDPPKARTGELTDTVTLKELLSESDAVTLHTPLTRDGEDATYHLIGKRELSMMKSGAILVNAARGAVVDFEALTEALEVNKIRGIIDTWEGEPKISAELHKKLEIGTFHIAGYSRQGKERATRMVLETIESFYGLSIDKSGLSGAYEKPDNLTAEEIINSYNPYDDDRMLREKPENFEQLRHDYKYREEVW